MKRLLLIIAFLFALVGVARAGYEDFDTFTEGADEGNAIAKDSSTKISWSGCKSRQDTGYWYKDYGANHFGVGNGGDHDHLFEMQFSSMTDRTYIAHYGLSTILGDLYDWRKARARWVALVSQCHPDDTENIYSELGDSGTVLYDLWPQPGPQASTTYFVQATRDRDGGANGTGQFKFYIRTGSHTGTLQDTLTEDASAGEQNDYQYGYPVASYDDNLNANTCSGFTQNLDLQEAAGNPWYYYHQQQ